MCGRFTHLYTWAQLHRLMGLIGQPKQLRQSYNVAPTQNAPVVRTVAAADLQSGSPHTDAPGPARIELVEMRWGLVPHWSPDLSIGARTINARAETVASRPAFREAFKSRRCIVPVSGFYEWRRTTSKGPKQPYYITSSDGQPLLLAGLWEHWRDKSHAAPIETFTIITTTPNELMAELHDRMPVILDPASVSRWLDPRTSPEDLLALLRPYPSELMMRQPVSTLVNSPSHNDSGCIVPVKEHLGEVRDSGGLFGN